MHIKKHKKNHLCLALNSAGSYHYKKFCRQNRSKVSLQVQAVEPSSLMWMSQLNILIQSWYPLKLDMESSMFKHVNSTYPAWKGLKQQ